MSRTERARATDTRRCSVRAVAPLLRRTMTSPVGLPATRLTCSAGRVKRASARSRPSGPLPGPRSPDTVPRPERSGSTSWLLSRRIESPRPSHGPRARQLALDQWIGAPLGCRGTMPERPGDGEASRLCADSTLHPSTEVGAAGFFRPAGPLACEARRRRGVPRREFRSPSRSQCIRLVGALPGDARSLPPIHSVSGPRCPLANPAPASPPRWSALLGGCVPTPGEPGRHQAGCRSPGSRSQPDIRQAR